jgi:acid phosphatase type 7
LSAGFSFSAKTEGASAPSVLYLTWMHDPSTTMTVHWQTSNKKGLSQVAYRKAGEEAWCFSEGIHTPLPHVPVLIHTVELNTLEPDTDYQFRLTGYSGEFKFRTLPLSLTRPVKFVVGGDAYFHLSTLRKMNRRIAASDPDFVVIGGDIAYTNSRKASLKERDWEVKRWRTFFKEWGAQMVTSEGRMIPLMPVLGNHDIKAVALKQKSKDFLFYQQFALQEEGVPYRVLDAGDYLSLFLLDSGHSYHIAGKQTLWLKKHLSSRENIAYKMAVYHVSAYPSVYPYQGSAARRIRSNWIPLFERYHLQVAFEHHNHAYKRTHPIKGGKIDPDGVIYMGDGSWGVSPRKPKKLWYLDAAAQSNAVCLVTLTAEMSRIDALDLKGDVIDAVTRPPTRSLVSWNAGRLMQH